MIFNGLLSRFTPPFPRGLDTLLGLPPTRIHDLRHFHATFLIASGLDPRTSADRLGHSSASFMLKTYAHAVARAQEHAAGVANDLLTRSGRF